MPWRRAEGGPRPSPGLAALSFLPAAAPSRAAPPHAPRHGQVSPAPAPGPAAAPGPAQPRASLSAPPCLASFTTASGAAARAPPAPAARSSRRPTRRTCASSTRVSGGVGGGVWGRGRRRAPREPPGRVPAAWQCVERDLRSQMGSERGLVEEYVEKMPNPSLKGERPRPPCAAAGGAGSAPGRGAAVRPLPPKAVLCSPQRLNPSI